MSYGEITNFYNDRADFYYGNANYGSGYFGNYFANSYNNSGYVYDVGFWGSNNYYPISQSFSTPVFSYPLKYNFWQNANYGGFAYNYGSGNYSPLKSNTLSMDTFSYSKNNYVSNLSGNYNYSINYNNFNTTSLSNKYSLPTPQIKLFSNKKTVSGHYVYATLSRAEAEKRAKSNPNLEELKNGKHYVVSDTTFTNDIRFAALGAGEVVDKACEEAGVTVTITSALGTKNSPHSKGKNSASHYNEENPKLDFGGGMSFSEAWNKRNKLFATGYFLSMIVEPNGDGCYHIDAQIDPEKLKEVRENRQVA